jgi:membrane-bound lytic murein transglycosylase D
VVHLDTVPTQTPPRRPTPPDSVARRDSVDRVSPRDLTRETVKVFGDSVAPPPTDTMAAPGAPVWDIDVHSYETHARVEDYVRIFSGRAKEVFALALQRQTRYGPMIRQRLRANGLPEDMTYLALVESWFNPHAYSRAAAVGFWQFMAGTARGMGLRVDWWVDERRDPVRSTEAAARLLRGLKDQYGSLYLAAAAYNGGTGRVSRGLARYADAMEGVEGEDRFFALAKESYLRPETRDYVPKIIGAALVGEEPGRYGVVVESLPPYAYDSVRVGGGVPLAAVANSVGAKPAELGELNTHILRGMTPPNDSMWIRVPVGSAAGFLDRFEALEPAERKALLRVESKKGQSMSSIASAHGISTKALSWFNPKVAKLKSGNLRPGQVILVPRGDVALLARDVPNPSIEKYPSRRVAGGVRRHEVVKGETMAGIARKYGLSVATLMKLNGLKKERVVAGQTLVVSGRSSSAKKGSATGKASAAKSSAKKSGAAKSSTKKATVKKPVAKKPAAKKPAAKDAKR